MRLASSRSVCDSMSDVGHVRRLTRTFTQTAIKPGLTRYMLMRQETHLNEVHLNASVTENPGDRSL